jgi:hypothetical protein
MTGLIAFDSEGNKTFSSSEVNRKLAEGDYIGAIIDILNFLGYDVSEKNLISTDLLKFQVDGVDVYIRVLSPEGTEFDPEKLLLKGETPYAKEGSPIYVDIYFDDETNMTAAELYHTIGHEMVHVKHMTTGKLYEWEKQNSRKAALALTEVMAWQWNLSHLHVFNYPGAREDFLSKWRFYAKQFIRTMSGRLK